jgi:DNA repair exonuclease SbcCD ATPase subunit
MNLDDFLNHPVIISNKNQDSELSNLKYELNEARKIIKQQKDRIMELENKLYNKEINNNNDIIESLKNKIKSKDKELNELKSQLNKINNNETNEKFDRQQMMCVYFTSIDQRINFPISCINTDIFAEVEEKLYKEYPEYRETNNFFISNGKQILRFKTIGENNIGDGKPVILNVPFE